MVEKWKFQDKRKQIKKVNNRNSNIPSEGVVGGVKAFRKSLEVTDNRKDENGETKIKQIIKVNNIKRNIPREGVLGSVKASRRSLEVPDDRKYENGDIKKKNQESEE